ncbi:MAG: redoxin domain-containing protein [Propionibacteriaceae bacterium]
MPVGRGSVAPNFRARNQHGQHIELSTLAESALVFFYPFAFTAVCASELQGLRDRAPAFRTAGVRVLALSCDSPYALRVFAETEGFEADLVSDFWPHGEIASTYGVFDSERGCARRGSFLVDTERRIRWTAESAPGEARDIDEHLRRATELAG